MRYSNREGLVGEVVTDGHLGHSDLEVVNFGDATQGTGSPRQ